MILLDTDHVTLLQWSRNRESAGLRERLAAVASEVPMTTIVTYEEQTRGWLAYVKQANDVQHQVNAYARLSTHLENYRVIPVLGFDVLAAGEFRRLRRLPIRVGTMDLKIAAIALVNDATLLSRNLQDFRKVPGLRVEDWSA